MLNSIKAISPGIITLLLNCLTCLWLLWHRLVLTILSKAILPWPLRILLMVNTNSDPS